MLSQDITKLDCTSLISRKLFLQQIKGCTSTRWYHSSWRKQKQSFRDWPIMYSSLWLEKQWKLMSMTWLPSRWIWTFISSTYNIFIALKKIQNKTQRREMCFWSKFRKVPRVYGQWKENRSQPLEDQSNLGNETICNIEGATKPDREICGSEHVHFKGH